MNKPEL